MDMLSSMLMSTFSLKTKKIYSQKIKIACLRWNLVSTLIRISLIRWWCLLFSVIAEILCFDKFCSKIQSCVFRLLFGANINLNMLNSVLMFSFSALDQKHPFLENFAQISNCLLKLQKIKLGTSTNSNMQNFKYDDGDFVSMYKKWSFPLRISSVNVTKSAGNCGFGHIYWRNP